MNKILLALVATAGLLYANTLEKIQETKVISIGVRNNLPPVGYQDLNWQINCRRRWQSHFGVIK